MKSDVEELQTIIADMEKYILSGNGATDIAAKNARLEQEASWKSRTLSNGAGFIGDIAIALSAFMIPGMISLFFYDC